MSVFTRIIINIIIIIRLLKMIETFIHGRGHEDWECITSLTSMKIHNYK